MLDRLVESKNHHEENSLLNGLLATIFTASAIALTVAFAYSLFSFELILGGDLELSSLTAPTMLEEVQPEPQVVQKEQSTEKVTSENIAIRRENIQRPDESPVKPPTTISVTPSTNQVRPDSPYKIGKIDSTPSVAATNSNIDDRNNTNTTTKILTNSPNILDKNDTEEQLLITKPKEKKVVTISGGVVNGKAKYLAQPVYPAAAKQVRAEGKVEVQVTIDENGRVTQASVINGHPLLRDSALRAAKATTFSPTFLSKEPVKVTGIIIYNFKAQ